MADATIVSEDAKRLVAEGGVYNSNMPPPDVVVTWPDGSRSYRDREPPFTAEVKEWRPAGQWGGVAVKVGTVPVVDVHHAEDCATWDECTCGTGGPYWPHDNDCATRFPLCHPDAKPDMWHWFVEATP